MATHVVAALLTMVRPEKKKKEGKKVKTIGKRGDIRAYTDAKHIRRRGRDRRDRLQTFVSKIDSKTAVVPFKLLFDSKIDQ
jgi:hypothetical protein